MKNSKWILALIIVYLGPFFALAQKTVVYGGITWYLDYNEARKIALSEHKPIVILFTGSDWCPPCKALHNEVLPNKMFQDEAKGIIWVLADFPRRKPMSDEQKSRNRQLAMRFLGRGGLPTMVAVNPQTQTEIRRISGYNFYKHDIQPHINFLISVKNFYHRK